MRKRTRSTRRLHAPTPRSPNFNVACSGSPMQQYSRASFLFAGSRVACSNIDTGGAGGRQATEDCIGDHSFLLLYARDNNMRKPQLSPKLYRQQYPIKPRYDASYVSAYGSLWLSSSVFRNAAEAITPRGSTHSDRSITEEPIETNPTRGL